MNEPHVGNWYVLVYGLARPTSSMKLGPGVSLVPLETPLTTFDLAAAGAAGFHTWAALEPMTDYCTCEIETAQDAATLPGYDVLNRAWLASSLLVLRGFTRCLGVACSAYSWNHIAGHQERTSDVFKKQLQEEGVEAAVYKSRRELPPFQGNLLDYHVKIQIDRVARTDPINEEDAQWVNEHFNRFNQLAAEDERFRFALEAAIDWRYSTHSRTAVARLWSGIEAIFAVSSELVYRISSYAASVLEPRGELRKERFRATKKLYNLRSKVVHGESLDTDKIIFALNESYSLLRAILLTIIERGSTPTVSDLEDALFGE